MVEALLEKKIALVALHFDQTVNQSINQVVDY
jgi:hypothetical protein